MDQGSVFSTLPEEEVVEVKRKCNTMVIQGSVAPV